MQIRFMKLSRFKRSIVFQEHYSLAVINCCRLVTEGTVVAEVVKIDGAKLPVQAMVGKVKDGKVGANDKLNINEEGEGKKNKDVTKKAGDGEPDLNKQKKGEAKLPAEAVVGKGKDGKVGANDKLIVNEEGEGKKNKDVSKKAGVGEPDLNKQKKGEAKLPAEAVVGKGKDGGEAKFYEHLTGRKDDTDDVRMHVSSLIRDGSLSRKRSIVAENDGLIVTHDYFLRERTPKLSNVLEVDHTLECQFIAHCIMQTEVLRPLLRQVVLTSKAMSGQTEIVKAILKPIKDIHNCVNTANVGTFNLHLHEKNLNQYKGKEIGRAHV